MLDKTLTDLQKCRGVGDPLLPRPGAEQGQADLSTRVQVGVEPDPPPGGGPEGDEGRHRGVGRGELDVKLVDAAHVGTVRGTKIIQKIHIFIELT